MRIFDNKVLLGQYVGGVWQNPKLYIHTYYYGSGCQIYVNIYKSPYTCN